MAKSSSTKKQGASKAAKKDDTTSDDDFDDDDFDDDDDDIEVLETTSSVKKPLAKKTTKSTASSPKKNAKSPSAAAAASSPSHKKKKATTQQFHTVSHSMDVILPHSLGSSQAASTGECTLLVQIHPDDAAALDYEGSTGAIGRFSVDSRGIVLDLKGAQYAGRIVPGPTAMVASLQYNSQHQQELRLEAVTDEFCPLVQTQDLLAKLDGTIEGTMDDSYKLQEEDVNVLARQEQQQEQQQQKKKKKQQKNNDNENQTKKSATKKRPSNATPKTKTTTKKASTANKKQKVSVNRKKK